MTRSLRAFFIGRESEGGQAIILIALTLLAMLMIVGVAIDAGQVYSARRAMQEAADAAAYAASVTLYQGGNQTQAFAAAAADATTNGFTNGVASTTVTIVQPTTSPYNTSEYVEVTIVRNITTALVPAQSAITVVTSVRRVTDTGCTSTAGTPRAPLSAVLPAVSSPGTWTPNARSYASVAAASASCLAGR